MCHHILCSSKVKKKSLSVSSLSRHGEQAEHAVRPGPAVPHPEEALRELRSRHGQFGDNQHRSKSQPLLPQGTNVEPCLGCLLQQVFTLRQTVSERGRVLGFRTTERDRRQGSVRERVVSAPRTETGALSGCVRNRLLHTAYCHTAYCHTAYYILNRSDSMQSVHTTAYYMITHNALRSYPG